METTQKVRISLDELADAGIRIRESFPPSGDGKPLEAEYLESLGIDTEAVKTFVTSGMCVACLAPQFQKLSDHMDAAIDDDVYDEMSEFVFAIVGGTLKAVIAAVLNDRAERGL